jgi:hypothetical protein
VPPSGRGVCSARVGTAAERSRGAGVRFARSGQRGGAAGRLRYSRRPAADGTGRKP